MTQPTYDLLCFQFRDDDGGETDATFRGSLNDALGNWQTGSGNIFRLRIELYNDNAKSGTETFTWQYSYDGGAYTDITTSSSYVRAIASGLTDGSNTTQQLTANSTFFGAGNVGQDETGTWGSMTFPASNYHEAEGGFYLVDADVADGKTINIRIVEASSDVITFTNTPSLTVEKAGTTPVNKDMQALWDIRELVYKDTQIKFDITELVYKELQALWDIFDSVYKDLQAKWDIRELVYKDLQAVWDMSGAVSKDLQAKWDITNLVNKSSEFKYDILNLVNKSIEAVYDIRELVNKSFQAKWDILSSGEVAKTIGIGIGRTFHRITGRRIG